MIGSSSVLHPSSDHENATPPTLAPRILNSSKRTAHPQLNYRSTLAITPKAAGFEPQVPFSCGDSTTRVTLLHVLAPTLPAPSPIS